MANPWMIIFRIQPEVSKCATAGDPHVRSFQDLIGHTDSEQLHSPLSGVGVEQLASLKCSPSRLFQAFNITIGMAHRPCRRLHGDGLCHVMCCHKSRLQNSEFDSVQLLVFITTKSIPKCLKLTQ